MTSRPPSTPRIRARRSRFGGTCVGSFVIDKSLSIARGPGASSATIAAASGRPLTITAGTVRVVGLRITGGDAPDCPAWPNHRCGGGIYAADGVNLTLLRVRVDGNSAGVAASPTEHAYGGGIYSGGALFVVDSSVSANTAVSGGAHAQGGGIASDGALTIRRSRVAGNSASSSGDGAQAGGIYQHRAGPVLIQDSTIEGNLARGATNAAGCGMYADGPFRMTIKGSTFSANAATATGGLGAFGGGLRNSATTTIENSTFVRNTARYGGGVAGDGALRLRASTVARNKALTRGGGLYVDGGSVSIGSTILAGNRTAGARKDCWIGGSVSVVDRGRTLLGSGTGCPQIAKGLRGNKVGSLAKPIDPRLGSLAANGGPTRTLGLLAGSPAINAAGKAPCTTRTDQRGVRRPQGGRCDIGAVERRGRAPF